MNAFRSTRMFALVACTTVVALSFSAAAQANGGNSCHGSSRSFGSCHSSYGSYCPSYSSYCPSYSSYCPSYSSYCPSYCSYPVSYCQPTYCAPSTCYEPVATCSYEPVTQYVPVYNTSYVPTTCNYSCAPTYSYPTCSYSTCNYLPSYSTSCIPFRNFKK